MRSAPLLPMPETSQAAFRIRMKVEIETDLPLLREGIENTLDGLLQHGLISYIVEGESDWAHMPDLRQRFQPFPVCQPPIEALVKIGPYAVVGQLVHCLDTSGVGEEVIVHEHDLLE